MEERQAFLELALELKNVGLLIEGQVIFRNLSFQLQQGESCLIIGASGSGKSLLLKTCAGLFLPAEGTVRIGGTDPASASPREMEALGRRIGFLFQDSALISNMAIYDNLALPLRYHTNWSERKVRERVEEKMTLFAVDRSLEALIPAQLSGEMRKRTALARALIMDPDLLLLDHPAEGLSLESAQDIMGTLSDYQKKTGATLLQVSAEWPSAASGVERVAHLEGGRIAAEGSGEKMRDYFKRLKKSTFQSAEGSHAHVLSNPPR
jgi:phospholipid/cholesterol/gamma-HCH transport system ATP-binding protein